MRPRTLLQLAEEMAAPEIDSSRFAGSLNSLFDPHTGIGVGPDGEDDSSDDEFSSYAFRVDLHPSSNVSDWGYLGRPAVGGRGDYLPHAKRGAMFEAIERYSLSIVREKDLVVSSYENLRTDGRLALDPATLIDGASNHAFNEMVRGCAMRWTEAYSVICATTILVPAQCVFLPYEFEDSEPTLRDPLTTGAASGMNRGKALLRGLMEVIERDATMMCHYGQLPTWRLDETLKIDPDMRAVFREADRLRFELRFFDVSADHPISVVACAIRDLSKVGSSIVVCSKASFDLFEAAKGAFLEASCFHRAQRGHRESVQSRGERMWQNPLSIVTAEDRASFIVNDRMFPEIQELWNSPPRDKRPHSIDGTMPQGIKVLLESCIEKGGDIIFSDVTSRDLQSFGCKVVKVIVPGFQPMHIREGDKVFSSRLRKCAKAKLDGFIPHPYV